MTYPLDPYERDPRETGYIPFAAVRHLECLGCPRRVALTIRLEQLTPAIHYYSARAAFHRDAVRKAAAL